MAQNNQVITTIITDIPNDIVEIQEAVVEINDEIELLQTDVETLQTDLTTLEGTVTTNTTDINTLETNLGTTNSNVDGALNRLDTAEDDIDALETDLNALDVAVGSFQSGLDLVEADVATLETDLDTLETTVSGHTSTLSSHTSTLSSHTSSLSTLSSADTALDSRLDAIEVSSADISLIHDTKLGLINFKSVTPTVEALAVASTTNIEALQAWSDGGWKNDPAPYIDLRGKRVPINDTWTMGQMNGMLLLCTGGTEAHSENQFGSGATLAENVGGANSALVWTDKDNLSGPMAIMDGNFAHISGVLTLQGNYDYDDPQDLKDDDENRKEVGLRILGRDVAGACPTGKFTGNVTCIALETGIETVDTPYEDAADQLHLGRCFSHYCDTFFKANNIQTLGCEFGYFDQLYTPTGFLYAKGGMHLCRQHVMQGGCFYGLVITGNDTNIFGTFDTEKMIMDGTSNATAYALYVDPVGGYVAPNVRMRLDISPNIANRKDNPIIRLRFTYGQYDFSHSNFLYERCIHVQDGVSGFFPTIRIKDACFHQGSDMNSIRKLFTVSSRGYVNIIFADNTEKYGSTGSANSGKTYDAYRNLINITGDGNSDFTVI